MIIVVIVIVRIIEITISKNASSNTSLKNNKS